MRDYIHYAFGIALAVIIAAPYIVN